jgi:hypothetical protein
MLVGAVTVLVGVSVGVLVGVSVGVLVAVFVGVFVGVSVGVLVGVFVGVFVGVLVCADATTGAKTTNAVRMRTRPARILRTTAFTPNRSPPHRPVVRPPNRTGD